MKVLFLAKTLTKGGAASGARNLINALRGAGAEVVALDAYDAQAGKVIGSLRKVERLYERIAHDAGTHCLRLGPPVFNLRELYATYHPDVIQLGDISGNTIRFSDLHQLPCAVVHRMSDFWPYHGARHYADVLPERRTLADHLLRWTIYDGRFKPDMFVAPSHWLASRLGERPVQVIRNAVSPVPEAAPRSEPRKPLRFGFIANPLTDRRKGFEALPESLAQLARQMGPVELHLFGKRSARDNPTIPNVKLAHHGVFSREDLAAVYGQFDILLCPSLHDNSPNAVTEALAHGVPVVAQSGTGMDSYIDDAFGALVDFHGGHTEDFVTAVKRISKTYRQSSENALDFAHSELRSEVIGLKYLELYAELSQQRRETEAGSAAPK